MKNHTALTLVLLTRILNDRQGFPVSRRVQFVLSLIAIGLLLPACGKRRPPLPPIERIPQRTELLSGAQRGNHVILSWPAPRRNASDTSVQSIRRIDVYRLAEAPTAPLAITETEFSARSTLVGSVEFDQIQKAVDNLTYVDALELAGQPARLRYAVRYVNAAGQSASFSNFLLIEPTARVAAPPSGIRTDLSEKAITLHWQSPTKNIDGSTPVNLLGFNIYRTSKSDQASNLAPLNAAPVIETSFVDRNFSFGQDYQYVVRSVSLGSNGLPVESLNSSTAEASPRDIYPPGQPGPVSPNAAVGEISIFFPSNPEPDVIGYKIYRSTDASKPLAQWTLLTPTPYVRNTYHDTSVEAGKRYFYVLVAIDSSGNVSKPSDPVSEVAQ